VIIRITYMRFFIAFILTLTCLPSFAMADIVRDIPYGTLEREKLDIYTPDNAQNLPVMIYIHGGGWAIGNKKRVQTKPEAFSEVGYIFVSVGYPLLPKHPVETQAQSIANAISWIQNNIKNYDGDPERIHLMGHSAGAHLVALIATDHSYLKKVNASIHDIQSVISIDGAAMNLVWRMNNLYRSKSERIFTNAFGTNKTRWEKLCPYHQATSDEYIPDFLFLTAQNRKDSNITAKDFHSKLQTLDVHSVVSPIADRDHSTINRLMGTKNDEAFAQIMDFLNQKD
ncbi:MAG: alpha/beta hydrolase, partial [Pseudomonadota bacterium]